MQNDSLVYDMAHAAVCFYKCGAAGDAPELSYGLRGRLYKSNSGWLLLSVPNALGRGAFDALHEDGVEMPTNSDGKYNAHISVMAPHELDTIPGGVDAVTERGHEFSYTLGPVHCVKPGGWGDMSRVWFITVKSPALERLRRSYGLSSLPHNGEYAFHITFAVRRKRILQSNSLSKAANAAPQPVIQLLLEAKRESDRRNYGRKLALLREAIQRAPDSFGAEPASGPVSGLRHASGFQMHMPTDAIPGVLRKQATAVENCWESLCAASQQDLMRMFSDIAYESEAVHG